MELYECVSGARAHANYLRPGGIAPSIPSGLFKSVEKFISGFSDRVGKIKDLLTNNRI